MSLAAETRRAVDRHPFLRPPCKPASPTAPPLPVISISMARSTLLRTALRRYAEELLTYETESRDVRVRMSVGFGPLDGGDERGTSTAGDGAIVTVGGTAFGPRGGDRTAIVATGDVDTAALAAVLARLSLEDIFAERGGRRRRHAGRRGLPTRGLNILFAASGRGRARSCGRSDGGERRAKRASEIIVSIRTSRQLVMSRMNVYPDAITRFNFRPAEVRPNDPARDEHVDGRERAVRATGPLRTSSSTTVA